MRRDLDLAREILIALEETETFDDPLIPEIPKRSTYDVSYHIKLLREAGPIDAQDWSTDDSHEYYW